MKRVTHSKLFQTCINVFFFVEHTLYSDICSEMFEESVIHKRKMYCFTHLSFQEFLAAFYAFHCYLIKNTEPLRLILNKNYDYCDYTTEEISLYQLLDSAVDKALQSKTGHLDLLLRFMLGILLETSQKLLRDLLTRTRSTSKTLNTVTHYVLDQIKGLSTDRSIDLLLCVWSDVSESEQRDRGVCEIREEALCRSLFSNSLHASDVKGRDEWV